jgi:hypothetical protein
VGEGLTVTPGVRRAAGLLWLAVMTAGSVVLTVSLRAEIRRADRLALLLLMTFVYAAVLAVLWLVSAAAWRLPRVAESRLGRLAGGPAWSAAGVFLAALAVRWLRYWCGHTMDVFLTPPPLWNAPAPVEAILIAGTVAGVLALLAALRRPLERVPSGAMAFGALALVGGAWIPPLPSATPVTRAAVLATPPDWRPVPRRPLVLVAFDGVDPRLLRSAAGATDLPEFRRLMQEGFRSSLDNHRWGYSPVVWTSVATGLRARRHGIHDFLTRHPVLFREPIDGWWKALPPNLGAQRVFATLRPPLMTTRATNAAQRPGASVWQVLSRAGRRSLVVNWLGSFPAEKVDGIVLAGDVYDAKLDAVRAGTDLAGYEYPPGSFDRLHGPFAPRRPPPGLRADEPMFDSLERLTLRALDAEPFDFVAFFTHWTDAPNHHLGVAEWRRLLEGDFASARGQDILHIYRRLDRFLGALRERRPEANFVVLSDHGVAPVFRARHERLDHLYESPGIFFAQGPDAGRQEADSVSMLDVGPSVIGYFGAPVALDIDGTVDPRIFPAATAPQYIDTYQDAVPRARVAMARREPPASVRERLRALGYVN